MLPFTPGIPSPVKIQLAPNGDAHPTSQIFVVSFNQIFQGAGILQMTFRVVGNPTESHVFLHDFGILKGK